MSLFNLAHTFYFDASSVANSSIASISSIGLFFMYRPDPLFNRSTQENPGVQLYFTDVVNDVPNLANTEIFQHVARAEWNEIISSSDASAETIFTFNAPIQVQTNKPYAFIISYDNDEDFLLWTNTKGNKLVGTNNLSTGPSSQFGGKFFQGITINSIEDLISVSQTQNLWTPLDDTYLKFKVYAARFAINNNPIFANSETLPPDEIVYTSQLFWDYEPNTGIISVMQPSPRVEIIGFNQALSQKQAHVGGQRVYQKVPYWPGGGVFANVSVNMSNTITATSTLSNGATFSWNDVFSSYAGEKYIVFQDTQWVDIRKVTSIVSNTVITIDEPTTFVNSSANFMIAPVANVDSFNVSFITGKKQDLMFLRDSNANSSIRFTGNSIDSNSYVITDGGTDYDNTDIIYLTGYEDVSGAHKATARLITNTSGGITSLLFSNIGASFSNSANITIVVANSSSGNTTANTSDGSGLTLTVNVSSIILTEQTNNIFRDCVVTDIDLSDITTLPGNPNFHVPNTSMTTAISFEYYRVVDDTKSCGYTTYVAPERMSFDMNYYVRTPVNTMENLPAVVSRSNEFQIKYANNSSNDRANDLVNYSNNFLVTIQTYSNNDYVALGPIFGPTVEFGRYIINNDYTNEHTNYGNALARHVMVTIPLAGLNLKYPEDIRFYMTAFRPPTTDFQVYARIQNQSDSQAFDDEDWTRLQLVDGDIRKKDFYIEMTYAFQSCPNIEYSLAGYASTTNASATITGVGTTFESNLAQYDLIKVYDPLFPNDNFAVLMVNSIASNTQLVVNEIFSTNTVTGVGGPELADRSGLKIDKIEFPHQGYNNIQFDNVVRYFNQSMHSFDTFDKVQMKIILLSSDLHNIPRIHNLRGINLSS